MKINCTKLDYFIMAKIFGFIFIISALLVFTGKIVRAKFIGDSTTIVNGFYAEKKNDIDVIIIGSSNGFCTVDPVTLYDEYGIAAYDFCSSSQQMNMSLLYLKEALKRQSPRLIALEVNYLVGDTLDYENEAALRWGFTDIPLSLNKLKCIYNVEGGLNADFFSYVFPIFRYHGRWNELSKIDYTYFCSDKTSYSKGYFESCAVSETPVNLYGYDCEGDVFVDERNISYLDEILDICNKNNIKLMLFKSPRENWYKYETSAVEKLAAERNIEFVDYNKIYYNGGIELDTSTDFRDYKHLNDYGAKKVTLHLGEFIKANYDIPDRRGEEIVNSWDIASNYRSHSGWQEFMDASSVSECLGMIQDDENYIIIVTDSGSENVRQWVYENCQVKLDISWTDDGIKHMKIGKSKLVLSKLGAVYQILIDGIENYQAGSRWNIIVYDKVTQSVVANLNFDV
jgi:hypothetical protein